MNYHKPEIIAVSSAISAIKASSMSKLATDQDSQKEPSDPAYRSDE